MRIETTVTIFFQKENINTPQKTSSLHEVDELLALQRECNTALECLYLAVDERIAKDVNDKVRAYIAALEQEKQPPIASHEPLTYETPSIVQKSSHVYHS
jgi:hypothetical protein